MNYAHAVTVTCRGVTSVDENGVPTMGTVTVLEAAPCAFSTASAGDVVDKLGSGVPVDTARQLAWLHIPGWLTTVPEAGKSFSDYRLTLPTFSEQVWLVEATQRGVEATRYLLSTATV